MGLEVTTDFPGGNGIVAHLPDGVLLLDRDIRDSVGDRWYWRVRFHGDRSAVALVRMARPGLLGRFGPWIRLNGQAGWLSSTPTPDGSFNLAIEPSRDVDASATVAYGPEQLRAFVGRSRDLSQTGGVCWTELVRSEDGRSVPVATTGAAPPRRTILLTARHHACEVAASYVLEGAVAMLLQMRRDGQRAAATTELIAVPMIDIDGVWRGDQGKTRRPWDHNRDYRSLSRYSTVAALRRLVESTDRPLFALDLHTPGLRGEIEEKPYVVASGSDEDIAQARELLRAVATTGAELLIFDEEWNDPASTGQRCCAAWLRSLRRTRVALTIEYPNAVDRGRPVTPESARQFGGVLIRASVDRMVSCGTS